MEKNLNFKKDHYRNARGGYSRFLEVRCESCGALLAIYQKDRPGALRRMYLDRIVVPKIQKKREFVCSSCKKVIGTFSVYVKENRPAIRLYQDAVTKKVIRQKSVSRRMAQA